MLRPVPSQRIEAVLPQMPRIQLAGRSQVLGLGPIQSPGSRLLRTLRWFHAVLIAALRGPTRDLRLGVPGSRMPLPPSESVMMNLPRFV